MMREGFTDSLIAYQHFLSGFSCLVVPFEDSPRREYICSALGFDGWMKAVILDPSEQVLFHGYPSVFYTVGGAEHECFPFTVEREEICIARDDALQDLSLNELLGLGDTDVLCNISKDARITASELKQKFVGLYVCCDGHSLRTLQKVHEECKWKKYDLEIVGVCCPCLPVPSKMHEELMVDALATCKLLDWWFSPFNNTVSHRLLRMCEEKSGEEGFFIVDPIEKGVDPYGLPIIVDFGMDSYPFTRRSLVEKELQRKMGLRLSLLLLPWGYVCHKPDGGGSSSIVEIPVAEALNNKTVLLYLYTEKQKDMADKLARFMWYEKAIRRKKSNVEVVAVSINGSGASDEYFMKKRWYWFVCPADPTKSAKLRDQYFHPRCREGHEVHVAFGEDGRIQSLDASQFLESGVPPFHGNLREEIGLEFYQAGFDDYMLHYDLTV